MTEAWDLKDNLKDTNISSNLINESLNASPEVSKEPYVQMSDPDKRKNRKRKGRTARQREKRKSPKKNLCRSNLGMPSTITFDDNNNYFSATCGLCKKTKIELNKAQYLSNKIFSFNDLTSTFGAVWEMVANVM